MAKVRIKVSRIEEISFIVDADTKGGRSIVDAQEQIYNKSFEQLIERYECEVVKKHRAYEFVAL